MDKSSQHTLSGYRVISKLSVKMQNQLPRLLSLLGLLLVRVDCFSTGPPVDSHMEICSSLFPTGHNATAQKNSSPFKIRLGNTCYTNHMDLQSTYLSKLAEILILYIFKPKKIHKKTKTRYLMGQKHPVRLLVLSPKAPEFKFSVIPYL